MSQEYNIELENDANYILILTSENLGAVQYPLSLYLKIAGCYPYYTRKCPINET